MRDKVRMMIRIGEGVEFPQTEVSCLLVMLLIAQKMTLSTAPLSMLQKDSSFLSFTFGSPKHNCLKYI